MPQTARALKADPKVRARRGLRVYIEPRDWWIGYYRGDTHHYVCPLPTLVVRWNRKTPDPTSPKAAR